MWKTTAWRIYVCCFWVNMAGQILEDCACWETDSWFCRCVGKKIAFYWSIWASFEVICCMNSTWILLQAKHRLSYPQIEKNKSGVNYFCRLISHYELLSPVQMWRDLIHSFLSLKICRGDFYSCISAQKIFLIYICFWQSITYITYSIP